MNMQKNPCTKLLFIAHGEVEIIDFIYRKINSKACSVFR